MTNSKKKAMICFYKGNICEDISILEDFDSKGFEVHLFEDLDENNLEYDKLLNVVKDLCGSKINEYDIYISSNIKEFIMLEYILYKNFISGALYINRNPEHVRLDKLYATILNKEININASNFYLLKDEEVIFNDYNIFHGTLKKMIETDKFENTIYIYEDKYHVFSVSDDKEKKNINVVNLDNSPKVKDYKYHIDLEYLDEYIRLIDYYSNSINEFIQSYEMIYSQLDKLKSEILSLTNFEKNLAKFKLDNYLYYNSYNDKQKIFLCSFLLDVYNDKEYLEFLLELLTKSSVIDKYNRFFAYYQCVRRIFVNKGIISEHIEKKVEKLYEKIYDEFSMTNGIYAKISKEQRNDDIVFVVTSQFLDVNHAPTKVTLDMCYNLTKNLNKQVLLINTKEVLTLKGIMPMNDITSGNVVENYDSIDSIEYKGEKIAFYQSKGQMPNDNEIINILNTVQKYKPKMIINIGTTLVGELCTKIIPTITIPLGNDGYSKSTFYIVNDEDAYKNYASKHNRNKNSLIVSKLQFELNPKEHIVTKEQLGIPENKFIIAIIGNRLNKEIDEKFLEMLEKSCKFANAYVLFIDKFNFTEQQIAKYENLVSNYKNLGYQKDLLAVLENTDLYVNPDRSGGGTSAIYSIYLGKPVVTVDKGDVASNVGKEFCVGSYDEMFDEIIKYYNEEDFYNNQSIIAKSRALELTDVSQFVRKIYGQVVKSPLF